MLMGSKSSFGWSVWLALSGVSEGDIQQNPTISGLKKGVTVTSESGNTGGCDFFFFWYYFRL